MIRAAARMEGQLALLLRTTDFAAVKHKNQRRKDKANTPYINHPVGVATLLSDVGGINDLNILQAALLHDTVEDTETTFEELTKEFGGKVTSIVKDVTDDKTLPKVERKIKQIEHSPHISYEAKCVKLADKLYNLRDILSSPPNGWSPQRCQGYFVWAERVVDGLRGTNKPLEALLDETFSGSFTMDGKSYPALPEGVDKQQFLDNYLKSIAQSGEVD
mmetsp:Transcript_49562/g.124619  ORF Transcript_49562/g.124619 Transcript_49562/m.124619 type:complete len:218 (-) Transcript_49562:68-721(-)